MEIKRSTLAGRSFLIIGCALLLCLPFFTGCAKVSRPNNVLAVVDGSPITEADLAYALNISHRKEDLSSAKSLDISSYLEKLIDDRLIFDEALLAGMDQLPEVQKKVEAYITRESVVKLHDEDIMQKVSVTEDDITSEYIENYFHFGVIEMKSGDDAKAVQEKLANGDDFGELARTYSVHRSKENGGEVIYARGSIAPSLIDALSGLKPDEISDVINIGEKYYLIKLYDKKGNDEILKTRKDGIAELLKKKRQKELEDSYTRMLREKAAITINEEVLSGINFAGGNEELAKWVSDVTPLAEVNKEVITAGDFVKSIPQKSAGSIKTLEEKKRFLDKLIDVKLVNQEALSRHYEMKDLKNEVERYENYLLKEIFLRKTIIPNIDVKEKDLEDYYARNQKQFTRPGVYKLQQIQVRTMEEAEDAMGNLKNGADFLWLAKKMLPSTANETSINMGWVAKGSLPEPLREVIDSMKPGEVSPIFKNNGFYAIVQLLAKTGEKVDDFESVREKIRESVFDEKYKSLLDGYKAELREKAHITINDAAVQTLKDRFQK